MNAPKVSCEDYINFLVATPRTCTGVEAARTTSVCDLHLKQPKLRKKYEQLLGRS